MTKLIPIVRGAMAKKKKGPIEDPTSLVSRAAIRIVDIISEGEIVGLVDGGKSIYLDEQPLLDENGKDNFPNVQWQLRTGAANQTPLDDFDSVENELGGGRRFTQGTTGEFVGLGPYEITVTDHQVDAVRVKVRVPALGEQTDKGDLKGYSVRVQLSTRIGATTYVAVINDIISGKTSSGYERSYRVNLPASNNVDSRYVQVARLTPDATTDKIQDETHVASYTLIKDVKMIHPDTALVGIKFDAESFGGRVPQRAYRIRGIKVQVPTNYDPVTRTYATTGAGTSAGVWDGTFKLAWTNNPAWIYYDLLINKRYGLGEHVKPEYVDKYSLYLIGQYCDASVADGYGGSEPRYTLNTYIGAAREAYDVIQSLASNFRALTYWAAGAITAVQDRPRDAVQVVSPANVIDGVFTYQSSALKDRHTVALVTWNDPKDLNKPAVEVVEHPEGVHLYGYRPIEITAYGCTSRAQAYRQGRWLLETEQSEKEIVTYAASLDHLQAFPGDIVKIQDPTIGGARFGGRIAPGSTTTSINLDGDVIVALNDSITIMRPNGELMTANLAASSASTTTVAVTGTALPEAPVAGMMWVISTANVPSRLFRIQSIRETDKHIFEVTATAHDPSKYARVEQNLAFEPINYGNFRPLPVGIPTNAVASETVVHVNNQTRSRVLFSWSAPAVLPTTSRPEKYEVRATTPAGVVLSTIETGQTSFEFPDCEPGAWKFEVRATRVDGRASNWLVFNTTVTGKKTGPAAPTGLSGLAGQETVFLSWANPVNVDFDYIEVWSHTANDLTLATKVGTARATSFTHYGVAANVVRYYWIRAVDQSGNIGAWNAAATAGTAVTPTVSALVELEEIGKDSVLHPMEKLTVIREKADLDNEQADIRAKADALGVSRTAYDNSHAALTTYLNGLSPAWNNTTVNTTIVRVDWNTKWNDVYTARQNLLNAIDVEASKRATWTNVRNSDPNSPDDNATVGARPSNLIVGSASNVNLDPLYSDEKYWGLVSSAQVASSFTTDATICTALNTTKASSFLSNGTANDASIDYPRITMPLRACKGGEVFYIEVPYRRVGTLSHRTYFQFDVKKRDGSFVFPNATLVEATGATDTVVGTAKVRITIPADGVEFAGRIQTSIPGSATPQMNIQFGAVKIVEALRVGQSILFEDGTVSSDVLTRNDKLGVNTVIDANGKAVFRLKRGTTEYGDYLLPDAVQNKAQLWGDVGGTGRPADNATVGAQVGVNISNSAGTQQYGPAELLNELSVTGAQSSHVLFFNQKFDVALPYSSPVRPAGIRATSASTTTMVDNQLGYVSGIAGGDLAVGISGAEMRSYIPMWRVNPKSKYRIRGRVKASAATTSGLYMMFMELDVEPAPTVTHIGHSGTYSDPAMIGWTRERLVAGAALTGGISINNAGLTTDYQNFDIQVTPTSTAKFMGGQFTRWTGMGAAELHFDSIVVEEIAASSLSEIDSAANSKLGGIEANATNGAAAGTNLRDSGGVVLGDAAIKNSAQTWAEVSGTGRPQDNATVGAIAGTNLRDSGGVVLGDTAVKNSAQIWAEVSGAGRPQDNATVGADWAANLANKPTSLAGINSTEGSKLGGIETGANRTGQERAHNRNSDFSTGIVDGKLAGWVHGRESGNGAFSVLANNASATRGSNVVEAGANCLLDTEAGACEAGETLYIQYRFWTTADRADGVAPKNVAGAEFFDTLSYTTGKGNAFVGGSAIRQVSVAMGVQAGTLVVTVPDGAKAYRLVWGFEHGVSSTAKGIIDYLAVTRHEPSATNGAVAGANLRDSGGALLVDAAIKNSAQTWAEVSGAGRPADNATVGAVAGSNLKDSGGAILGDTAIKNSAQTWAEVSGAGRPADNATVGAIAGTNLKDSGGVVLGDAAVKNSAQTWAEVSGAGRPADNATVGGTVGTNIRNAGGTVMSAAEIENKHSVTSAQGTSSLFSNPKFDVALPYSSPVRPLGVRATSVNTTTMVDHQLGYVGGTIGGDLAVGVGGAEIRSYIPFWRVNPKFKYRIRGRVKASAATTSGLYIRFTELDSEPPGTATHIGISGTYTDPEMVGWSRERAASGTSLTGGAAIENAGLSTGYQNFDIQITPSSTAKFMGGQFLRWTGMGAAELHFDSIVVEELSATNLSELDSGANSKLGGIAAGATVGAVIGGNLKKADGSTTATEAMLLNANQQWTEVSGASKPSDGAGTTLRYRMAAGTANAQGNTFRYDGVTSPTIYVSDYPLRGRARIAFRVPAGVHAHVILCEDPNTSADNTFGVGFGYFNGEWYYANNGGGFTLVGGHGGSLNDAWLIEYEGGNVRASVNNDAVFRDVAMPAGRKVFLKVVIYNDSHAGKDFVSDIFFEGTSRASDPTILPTSAFIGVTSGTNAKITAADVGTNVTVDVSAHDRSVPGPNGKIVRSYAAGSITGLNFSTYYLIYVEDPSFVGGTLPYRATTNADDLLYSGRAQVGSVTTPADGGTTSTGSTDSGGGGGGGTVLQ